MSELMTLHYGGCRFEKYKEGSTINVYDAANNKNFYAFVNYDMGGNEAEFKAACIEHYNDFMQDIEEYRDQLGELLNGY